MCAMPLNSQLALIHPRVVNLFKKKSIGRNPIITSSLSEFNHPFSDRRRIYRDIFKLWILKVVSQQTDIGKRVLFCHTYEVNVPGKEKTE